MGLFSFLGGLLGSGAQKKGINKAAAAQVKYLGKGITEEQGQYDQSRSDFMPYMDFGKTSLGPLGDLLGMNGPEAAQAAIAALQSSPIYTSLYRNGEEAVLQNASATGGIRGGNTQRGLADFGADTLAQVMQQQIANLFKGAGLGGEATGNVANLGAHKADAIASLFGQQGDALAGKYLAKGGINAQNWNNAGGFLSKIFGGF